MQPITTCPACGEALVDAPSGRVCPHLHHGRIYPRLTAEERAEVKAKAAVETRQRDLTELPQAERTELRAEGTMLYRLSGKLGYWHIIAFSVKDSDERAVLGRCIRHFEQADLGAARKWLKE
jgi:hypothetical protein